MVAEGVSQLERDPWLAGVSHLVLSTIPTAAETIDQGEAMRM